MYVKLSEVSPILLYASTRLSTDHVTEKAANQSRISLLSVLYFVKSTQFSGLQLS